MSDWAKYDHRTFGTCIALFLLHLLWQVVTRSPLFPQALVKVPSNARACVAVGGVELAVDLLASAHEAAERAVTPSQNNLIAATAHVEPPKVWYYHGKGEASDCLQ